MARWPSGPRRVTQVKACPYKGFSSSFEGVGSNPTLVIIFNSKIFTKVKST